ncbi:hypothetical protein CKALI_05020 [Corynebacterium kalinowskii]|uniref:Uncharacterized protein n=1 Tax=Corynebacterium kalinowskii TaxID=2675216 RepID=A0A6B8VFV9_9CORY|nr:hypothetical protein [Corynebacterium kalinowskii]QGU01879.1 hypothetical protein CKALI_05020 [Corynebacterium kalinowskii]
MRRRSSLQICWPRTSWQTRARLSDAEAVTDTGAPGRLTADGGVLLYSSAALPPVSSVGLSGPRPDGAFRNLTGKVRHICAGDDAACAVQPDGLLGATGSWANGHLEEYGEAATLQSMLFDGSLLRSLGPHAAAIGVALIAEDFSMAEELFATAAHAPGLTEAQSLAVRLFGAELIGASRNLDSFEIPADTYTGNSDLDRLLNVYQATHAELGYAASMPRNHSAYSGANRDYVLQINGARVDDWIQADMFNVIAAQIGDSRRAAPVPYSQRDTLWQRFGHWQWNVLQWSVGADHPLARQTWEFYGL